MRSRGTFPVRARHLRDFLRLRDQHRGRSSRAATRCWCFPRARARSPDSSGELQSGVFRIAQELGAPIVPVTVTGMYRVMRKGSLLIRPGHDVTVYCDAPIETRGTGRRELRGLIEQVRSVMNARLDAYWQSSAP